MRFFNKNKTSTRDFFLDVMSRVVWRKSTDVSEEYTISKFRVEKQAKKETNSACCVLQADFLLGLLFDPEDGDRYVPTKRR
jgi:hypothetical protein